MQFPDFVFETLPDDPSACDLSVPYIEYYPTRRGCYSTTTTSSNRGGGSRYEGRSGGTRFGNFGSNTNSGGGGANINYDDDYDIDGYETIGFGTSGGRGTTRASTRTSAAGSGQAGYLYRCLLCQRHDLCEEGIRFHCTEPIHIENAIQLHREKNCAKLLLDKWYRAGIVTGTTSSISKAKMRKSSSKLDSNNSDGIQYRIEKNIGLPAWKYHVQALLYRYMTTLSSDVTSGINKDDDVENCDVSLGYLEQAYITLQRYEFMERLSILELAIWKAACIVEMQPIVAADDTSITYTDDKKCDVTKDMTTSTTDLPLSSSSQLGPPDVKLDYFEIMEWARNGWKCNKNVMRKSNSIGIIIQHVIPFLGGENIMKVSTSSSANVANRSGRSSTVEPLVPSLSTARPTARPRPWASSSSTAAPNNNMLTLSSLISSMNLDSASALGENNSHPNRHHYGRAAASTTALGDDATSQLLSMSSGAAIGANDDNTDTNGSSNGTFRRGWSSRNNRSNNLKQQVTVFNFND